MTDHPRRQRAAGDAHEYTDANAVEWTFVARPQMRNTDEAAYVVLLIQSAWETRVAKCLQTDWETPFPDYARILAESLPAGGSRGQGPVA